MNLQAIIQEMYFYWLWNPRLSLQAEEKTGPELFERKFHDFICVTIYYLLFYIRKCIYMLCKMWSMIIMATRSYICGTVYMFRWFCDRWFDSSGICVTVFLSRSQNPCHAYSETDILSSSQGLFCWNFWIFLAT